jgi:hypothetical protein
MKRAKWFLLVVSLVAMVCAVAPAVSHAGTVAPPAVTETTVARSPGVEPDTRAGVIAAMGCGIGLRLSVLTLGYPIVVSTTVALCLYALVDALNTPD